MALAPGRPELTATKPVKPELDVALVEGEPGRIAKPWWEWLDQFWRWYHLATTTADRPTRLTKTDAGFPAFDITLNQPIWWTGTAWLGSVTSVTGTPPVVSSGGSAPAISMPPATASVNGYLTSADWTTFNGKAPLASPGFTGNPTAPTPTAGDNDTSIATTAFVTTATAAPSDGGEYVRVNGVWRLKEQAFDVGGLVAKDLAVPTSATIAQLSGSVYVPASAGTILRVSADGTTFFSGASDYSNAGSALNTGTGLYQAIAATAASAMYMMQAGDNTVFPQQFDCLMALTRDSAASQVFTLKADARHRDAAAAIVFRGWHGTGFVQTPTTSVLALKALRVMLSTGSAFGAGSRLNVRWIY